MREDRPWATIALVGAVAAVAAALVGASWEFGKDRIAANERAKLLASLSSVLDTRQLGDGVNPVLIAAEDLQLLGSADPIDVFVPIRDGKPVAIVFAAVAPGGYNGPINLLIGIDADSALITGVRTVRHRETPGLGDLIDIRKSAWIEQFNGTGLNDPDATGWKVRQEGGRFDAITGATVTPRAVIEAVHNTLLYFDQHKGALFEAALAAASQETVTAND